MRKWFDLMTLHKEDLAKLITFESVSILTDCRKLLSNEPDVLKLFIVRISD